MADENPILKSLCNGSLSLRLTSWGERNQLKYFMKKSCLYLWLAAVLLGLTGLAGCATGVAPDSDTAVPDPAVSVHVERTHYEIKTSADGGTPKAEQREGMQYVFRHGRRELFRFQGSPGPLPRPEIPEVFRRGGYLHSLRTPSGRVVSGDYPKDHLHHHGVWTAWTKTQFEGREPDFWNMGQRKGRVESVSESLDLRSGQMRLNARLRSVDMLAKPEKVALEEQWAVSAGVREGQRPYHYLDLVITQTCATDSPLILPEYHYGGLGLRGHDDWLGANNCLFLTASGDTNRLTANTTRGKWCWMGGLVEGEIAGMTVLCHPENFRFPQPMRLHPKEPFFCYAPQQLGEMRIEPGQAYVMRYRIIIADGQPTMAEADGWWAEYAGQ